MPERINVGTSDYAVGEAPQILATTGVGSCVAICLYDKELKTGALLHVMLPRNEGNPHNPLRYADTALNEVLLSLQKKSICPGNLVAKMVGGAQMFSAFSKDTDIGERNVTEIRRLLLTLGIPIEAEDVGGNHGRNVEFDLSTGLVSIHMPAHAWLQDAAAG